MYISTIMIFFLQTTICVHRASEINISCITSFFWEKKKRRHYHLEKFTSTCSSLGVNDWLTQFSLSPFLISNLTSTIHSEFPRLFSTHYSVSNMIFHSGFSSIEFWHHCVRSTNWNFLLSAVFNNMSFKYVYKWSHNLSEIYLLYVIVIIIREISFKKNHVWFYK